MTMVATRAIILAAGTGSRLRPLTDTRPKCLVSLLGRPLLDRQLEVLQGAGVNDLTVVAGYKEEAIVRNSLKKVVNPDYERSNMVSSLLAARDLFDGTSDILVCYGDIVYEPRVLQAVMSGSHAISVAIDRGWFDLWKVRMEDPLADAETLKIAPDGRIAELGRKPKSISDIQGQYIGLFKISRAVQREILSIYDALDPDGPYDGRNRANMFMTSFIQLLIDRGIDVGPAWIGHGWLEVDSVEDLKAYEALHARGALEILYDAR